MGDPNHTTAQKLAGTLYTLLTLRITIFLAVVTKAKICTYTNLREKDYHINVFNWIPYRREVQEGRGFFSTGHRQEHPCKLERIYGRPLVREY